MLAISPLQEKAWLRAELRRRRESLASGDAGKHRSILLQQRLLKSHFWTECSRIALYVSVRSEAGTELLLHEAWKQGKNVFLPHCREKEPGIMDLIACSSMEETSLSRFGIPEPEKKASSHILSKAEISSKETLIIVPALAVDRRGFRLGYGGGYYDRLLASALCPKAGLSFHSLVLDALPREPWDIPVDAVCTEEELLCFHP